MSWVWVVQAQVLAPIMNTQLVCMHLVEEALLCDNYSRLVETFSSRIEEFNGVDEGHASALKFLWYRVIMTIEQSSQVIINLHQFQARLVNIVLWKNLCSCEFLIKFEYFQEMGGGDRTCERYVIHR